MFHTQSPLVSQKAQVTCNVAAFIPVIPMFILVFISYAAQNSHDEIFLFPL